MAVQGHVRESEGLQGLQVRDMEIDWSVLPAYGGPAVVLCAELSG